MKKSGISKHYELAVPADWNCTMLDPSCIQLMLRHYCLWSSYVAIFAPEIRKGTDVTSYYGHNGMYYTLPLEKEKHPRSGLLVGSYITPETTHQMIHIVRQAGVNFAKLVVHRSEDGPEYGVNDLAQVEETLRTMRNLGMILYIDERDSAQRSNLDFAFEMSRKIEGLKIVLNIETLNGARWVASRTSPDTLFGCVPADVFLHSSEETKEFVRLIAGGGNSFFYGSGSVLSPHKGQTKHFAPMKYVMSVLADKFTNYCESKQFGLERLEAFTSKNGHQLHGVSVLDRGRHIHLLEHNQYVPEDVDGQRPVGSSCTFGYTAGWVD